MTTHKRAVQLTTLSNGLFAGAALALALSATACMKTGSVPCGDDAPCPTGYTCATDGVCDPGGGESCSSSSECMSQVAPYCVGTAPDKSCDGRCSGDTSCEGALVGGGPFCDIADGSCVACVPSAAGVSAQNVECGDGAPVCDAESRDCRKCEADSECGLGVCDLEIQGGNGKCVAADKLLYASPSGSNTTDCKTPANVCNLPRAISEVDDMRNTVVLAAGTYALGNTLVLPKDVTLVGNGTDSGSVVIDRDTGGSGPVLSSNDKDIRIRRLSLTGGDGTGDGSGFSCTKKKLNVYDVAFQANDKYGIESLTDCALTVSQSTFSGNDGGGIAVNGGQFKITNNFITASTAGTGVNILATPASSVLAFNTIVNNRSTLLSSPGGVVCVVPVVVANNIIYGNQADSDASLNAQASALCLSGSTSNTNYVGPYAAANPLKFVSQTEPRDYHLTAESTLVMNQGVVVTDVDIDFDGDTRADPPDIGADEFVDGL